MLASRLEESVIKGSSSSPGSSFNKNKPESSILSLFHFLLCQSLKCTISIFNMTHDENEKVGENQKVYDKYEIFVLPNGES